jgi:dihydropteroate synthase
MSVEIMAIVNMSPDSFSGDGLRVADEAAMRLHIERAIQEGADMLDIGGQSTRPGAEIISEEEEIARVVPAIRLARSLTGLPISIDSFKPNVVRAALAAGADIINDVYGGDDPEMVKLMVASGCRVVIMHNRGTPATMSRLTDYPNGVVEEVVAFFEKRTAELIAAGVKPENIIIDPGIGFAKTAPQSFEVTRRLRELMGLGFSVLYGASRKSLIGKALAEHGQPAPAEQRAVGTVVLEAYAMQQGASIIRTHDVAAAVRTRTMVEALLGQREVMA